MLRLYRPQPDGSSACGFRYEGPLSRFDHHGHGQSRGIHYSALSLSACVVEVFGDTGLIARSASSGHASSPTPSRWMAIPLMGCSTATPTTANPPWPSTSGLNALEESLVLVLTRLQPSATRFSFPNHELSSRKSQAVAIDDEEALDPQRLSFTTTSKPDKAAIKEVLKAGHLIPGAQLTSRRSWRFH